MENDDSNVLNCYCETPDEINDFSIPKVVFSSKNDLIYISEDIPLIKRALAHLNISKYVYMDLIIIILKNFQTVNRKCLLKIMKILKLLDS